MWLSVKLIVLLVIPTLLLLGVLENASAMCSTVEKGPSLCSDLTFNATIDKTSYQDYDYPLVTITGTPGHTLGIKIIDSASSTKISDTIEIGPSGKSNYSFAAGSFSYGKYQVQVSDGIGTVKLDFSIGTVSKSVQKSIKPDLNMATLLVYTNVPWQATIQTSSDTISINGITDTKYPFTCNDVDSYNVTMQSSPTTGNGLPLWTVANVMQDGKMLDVAENHLANGWLNLTGKCHVAQFPLSNNGLIYFTTDKTIFRPGEMIQVSGHVSQYIKLQFYVLRCYVQNSKGETIQTLSNGFSNLDTFNFNIITRGGLWKPDEYKIILELDPTKAKAETRIELTNNVQKQSGSSSVTIIPLSFKILTKDWVAGKISDANYTKTVQKMVKDGTLKIPHYYSMSANPQEIISWMKSNASLWLNGKMSDQDFANVIKYLNFNYDFLGES